MLHRDSFYQLSYRGPETSNKLAVNPDAASGLALPIELSGIGAACNQRDGRNDENIGQMASVNQARFRSSHTLAMGPPATAGASWVTLISDGQAVLTPLACQHRGTRI